MVNLIVMILIIIITYHINISNYDKYNGDDINNYYHINNDHKLR